MAKAKTTRVAQRSAATGKFVLGRAAYAKVAAVEGLDMSSDLKKSFRQFDADGTSASDRRAVLKQKYAKPRT